MIVCENNTFSQKFMDDVLTHELIHAYDVCRAKYDEENLKHLACTSVSVLSKIIWFYSCVNICTDIQPLRCKRIENLKRATMRNTYSYLDKLCKL